MSIRTDVWTKSAVLDIKGYLDTIPISSEAGMLNGLAGIVLFYWYIAKSIPGLDVEERFDELTSYLQKAYRAELPCTVDRGLPGVASVLELILQEQGDSNNIDYNCGVDTALLARVSVEAWDGELEFVQGLAGIAMYAARRARVGRCHALYAKIIDLFDISATRFGGDQLAWATPSSSRYLLQDDGKVEFNLSLAHGTPAVIASLIPAIEMTVAKLKVSRLVRSGCLWLLNQADWDASHGSIFSTVAGASKCSRLGWCYGDLGIAVTLARAAIALGDEELKLAAQKIGAHAAGRTTAEAAQAQDAGLCHGVSGIALMFDILSSSLGGDVELTAAADRWWTVLRGNYLKSGLTAFDALLPVGEARQFVPNAGFLVGYAGVGLAIMSMQARETPWRDLLLLG
ncbi:lanthionine synthetase LanC family protein [Xanthomonas sp. NCPPB 2632]|uniref:lanthionine synthetase LanC family protein n=1 Tax=Xanthomonas sp. NCPPB 2632 TaxID=3240912 RepID=UPI0035175EEB